MKVIWVLDHAQVYLHLEVNTLGTEKL